MEYVYVYTYNYIYRSELTFCKILLRNNLFKILVSNMITSICGTAIKKLSKLSQQ